MIVVERWTFWAGALGIVAGFALQVAVGASFDPYTGAGSDWSGLPIWFAFILLLFSASLGKGRRAEVAPNSTLASGWISVERLTFGLAATVLLVGLSLQTVIGSWFTPNFGVATNDGFIAALFALAIFLVSAVLGGWRLPESVPEGGYFD